MRPDHEKAMQTTEEEIARRIRESANRRRASLLNKAKSPPSEVNGAPDLDDDVHETPADSPPGSVVDLLGSIVESIIERAHQDRLRLSALEESRGTEADRASERFGRLSARLSDTGQRADALAREISELARRIDLTTAGSRQLIQETLDAEQHQREEMARHLEHIGEIADAQAQNVDELTRRGEQSEGRIGEIAAMLERSVAMLDELTARVSRLENPPSQRIDEEKPRPQNPRVRAVRKLSNLLKHIRPSQPLFNLSIGPPFLPQMSRACLDRCAAIEKALGGNVAGLRILEVGCSLGYNAFYFASRGAQVTGIDTNPLHVEACRLVRKLNGLPVQFALKAFDLAYAEGPDLLGFDIILLINESTSMIDSQGIEGARCLIRKALDKVPLMFVDPLAGQRDEGVRSGGPPADELDILGHCETVRIQPLGRFCAPHASAPTPLYAVSASDIFVNRRRYPVTDMHLKAYPQSPVGGGRSYFFTEQHFIKRFQFNTGGDSISPNKEQIICEISTLLDLDGRVPGIPKLVDFEITGDGATLVLEKLRGNLLSDLLPELDDPSRIRVVRNLTSILSELEKRGYHHNDIRTWNILVSGDSLSLIDMGLASPSAKERNVNAFLWVLWALRTQRLEGFDYDKDPPPKDGLDDEGILGTLAGTIVDRGLTSFVQILKELEAMTG